MKHSKVFVDFVTKVNDAMNTNPFQDQVYYVEALDEIILVSIFEHTTFVLNFGFQGLEEKGFVHLGEL